jgi:hypothetical protein
MFGLPKHRFRVFGAKRAPQRNEFRMFPANREPSRAAPMPTEEAEPPGKVGRERT